MTKYFYECKLCGFKTEVFQHIKTTDYFNEQEIAELQIVKHFIDKHNCGPWEKCIIKNREWQYVIKKDVK
jgi:hypothetical protein